jgi:dihydrofolate synthase / folylpolyglutamate synthase
LNRSLNEWLTHAETVHPRSIAMGLARVQLVGTRMGLLPWTIPSIIVAGTNGKGSVTVSCEQLLLAHGRRVGAGYSPHLHVFNERVRINGVPLEDADLCAGFCAVETGRGDTPLTYFEYATLVSLWCWREADVEFTVLEVGLGGRLDAFNVVDAQVAVVTSIGLDHQEYLGDTRELIGREKAGVFRRRQRVVLGRDMPVSVIDAAAELDCQVVISGEHFTVADDPRWLTIKLRGGAWDRQAAAIDGAPLATRLAPHNVGLAVMACAALLELEVQAARAAVGRAFLPGRMEAIDYQGRRFILDIAHNPHGAQFLANRLQQLQLAPRLLIMGNLVEKNSEGIAAAFTERGPAWIAVSTEGPRGQDAGTTAAAIRAAGGARIDLAGSVAAAIQEAVNRVPPDGVILVFGSFAVVAAARDVLGVNAFDQPSTSI